MINENDNMKTYEKLIRKVLKDSDVSTFDALVRALLLAKYTLVFCKPPEHDQFMDAFDDKEQAAVHAVIFAKVLNSTLTLIDKIEDEGKRSDLQELFK